jgi:hypothetical protein
MVITLGTEPGAAGRADAGIPVWLMAGPAPTDSPQKYQLRRVGDGYAYEEQTFEAKIARDGVVSFHDKKSTLNTLGLLLGPRPNPAGTPTLQGLLFGRKRRPPVVPQTPLPGSPADKLEASVVCPDRASSSCAASYEYLSNALIVLGAKGTMDITDEILRALGQDPYRVQKARFLAATFEVRMKMATAAQREDEFTSLDRLPAALATLWRDARYSVRERRRVLFELWCEADSPLDGPQVRTIIEAFIRRELPCGSPDAYTPAELQDSRAAAAGQKFSPYGDCGR